MTTPTTPAYTPRTGSIRLLRDPLGPPLAGEEFNQVMCNWHGLVRFETAAEAQHGALPEDGLATFAYICSASAMPGDRAAAIHYYDRIQHRTDRYVPQGQSIYPHDAIGPGP